MDLPVIVGWVGHIALFALALAVLAAAPRQRANQAFAIYVVATTARSFGVLVAGGPDFDWRGYRFGLHMALTQLVAAVGVVLLGLSFPSALRASDRRHVQHASLVGVGFGVLATVIWIGGRMTFELRSELLGPLPFAVFSAATAFFLVLVALRAHDESGPVAPFAIVTVAVALPWGLNLGRILAGAARRRETYPGEELLLVGLVLASVTAVMGLWLRNLHHRPGSRWGIVALWSVPAIVLLSLGDHIFAARDVDWGARTGALARVLVAAAVGFAIARGQVPGLSRKVRWGVSRGTVAAVFVAVFFVASELAQQIFDAAFGGAYAGIIAAGALVFAITPLQRAAERLAEKAVPAPSAPTRPATATDNEETYRRAVHLAVRDRSLSVDEEVHLSELAEALGIGAGRAAAILRDAKRRSAVVP